MCVLIGWKLGNLGDVTTTFLPYVFFKVGDGSRREDSYTTASDRTGVRKKMTSASGSH
jgi:hypothetical protein